MSGPEGTSAWDSLIDELIEAKDERDRARAGIARLLASMESARSSIDVGQPSVARAILINALDA